MFSCCSPRLLPALCTKPSTYLASTASIGYRVQSCSLFNLQSERRAQRPLQDPYGPSLLLCLSVLVAGGIVFSTLTCLTHALRTTCDWDLGLSPTKRRSKTALTLESGTDSVNEMQRKWHYVASGPGSKRARNLLSAFLEILTLEKVSCKKLTNWNSKFLPCYLRNFEFLFF